MKILSISAATVLFVVLITAGAASAQTNEATPTNETEVVELPEAGILPDSILFNLELWWEDIQRFFTFSNVRKAELEAKLAMKRIAEAEKLIEKGKPEIAEKHLLQFQNRLAAAYEKTEQASEKGKDVDALIEKLEANLLKQQEVLAKVYDRVPASAQEGVLNAMEKSASGLQNAITNVQKSDAAEEFKNKLKNKVENFGTTKKNEIKEHLQQKGIIDD
ncbi:hypothetical protein KKF61_02865 [Patescibacteria group bacterium]|nr:hypothetical protein [Patescibacteria group bacterium]